MSQGCPREVHNSGVFLGPRGRPKEGIQVAQIHADPSPAAWKPSAPQRFGIRISAHLFLFYRICMAINHANRSVLK